MVGIGSSSGSSHRGGGGGGYYLPKSTATPSNSSNENLPHANPPAHISSSPLPSGGTTHVTFTSNAKKKKNSHRGGQHRQGNSGGGGQKNAVTSSSSSIPSIKGIFQYQPRKAEDRVSSSPSPLPVSSQHLSSSTALCTQSSSSSVPVSKSPLPEKREDKPLRQEKSSSSSFFCKKTGENRKEETTSSLQGEGEMKERTQQHSNRKKNRNEGGDGMTTVNDLRASAKLHGTTEVAARCYGDISIPPDPTCCLFGGGGGEEGGEEEMSVSSSSSVTEKITETSSSFSSSHQNITFCPTDSSSSSDDKKHQSVVAQRAIEESVMRVDGEGRESEEKVRGREEVEEEEEDEQQEGSSPRGDVYLSCSLDGDEGDDRTNKERNEALHISPPPASLHMHECHFSESLGGSEGVTTEEEERRRKSIEEVHAMQNKKIEPPYDQRPSVCSSSLHAAPGADTHSNSRRTPLFSFFSCSLPHPSSSSQLTSSSSSERSQCMKKEDSEDLSSFLSASEDTRRTIRGTEGGGGEADGAAGPPPPSPLVLPPPSSSILSHAPCRMEEGLGGEGEGGDYLSEVNHLVFCSSPIHAQHRRQASDCSQKKGKREIEEEEEEGLAAREDSRRSNFSSRQQNGEREARDLKENEQVAQENNESERGRDLTTTDNAGERQGCQRRLAGGDGDREDVLVRDIGNDERQSLLKKHQGKMGAVLLKEEEQEDESRRRHLCLFRVWGPHIEKCWVQINKSHPLQERNKRQEGEEDSASSSPQRFEMCSEGEGVWGTVLEGVLPRTPYEIVLTSTWNDCFNTEGAELHRRDPYAKETDFNSNTCYVTDFSLYQWKCSRPQTPTSSQHEHDHHDQGGGLNSSSSPPPLSSSSSNASPCPSSDSSCSSSSGIPWNKLIIYELHPGTFAPPTEDHTVFQHLVDKIDHIRSMNFNAIELTPVQEFGGEWGYNPRLLMSIHSKYGTCEQLCHFVDSCHQKGMAVILDLVLNHGSSKLNSLWNWDGYGKENSGGIYFEEGGDTGWGRKFSFHKRQVRQMIIDAALSFIENYKVDGLRFDSVHNMPWDLLQEMTYVIRSKHPSVILIAEVTPENPQICKGAGFDSCWIHSAYYDAVKITRGQDGNYHADMLKALIDIHRGFVKSHQCINSVLGSHDQAGNKQGGRTDGRAGRYFVDLFGGRNNWHSRSQCRMWYSLQAMSRGLPMLFMGTETHQDQWWNVDPPHMMDWHLVQTRDVLAQQMTKLVAAANKTRLEYESLHCDDAPVRFSHVDYHNRVVGFARGSLLIVLNCSESQWDGRDYEVQTEWREKRFRQIFNSQAEEFGGWEGSWTASSSSSSGEGVKGHHEELLYSSAHARLAVKLPKWSVTVFEMIEG